MHLSRILVYMSSGGLEDGERGSDCYRLKEMIASIDCLIGHSTRVWGLRTYWGIPSHKRAGDAHKRGRQRLPMLIYVGRTRNTGEDEEREIK